MLVKIELTTRTLSEIEKEKIDTILFSEFTKMQRKSTIILAD